MIMDQQLRHILIDAKEEIRTLRRSNEILSAQMDMVNLFAQVLNTKPAERVQCMSTDVCFEIEKALRDSETPVAP